MENLEISPTFVLFICVLVTTFVMSSVESRVIKKLKCALGKDAQIIKKNTLSNPLQELYEFGFLCQI